jgi:hypothetical protein
MQGRGGNEQSLVKADEVKRNSRAMMRIYNESGVNK